MTTDPIPAVSKYLPVERNADGTIDLMGIREVADFLDVARSRASDLATLHSMFPKPVANLGATRVWLASDVREFKRVWPRKPGVSVVGK